MSNMSYFTKIQTPSTSMVSQIHHLPCAVSSCTGPQSWSRSCCSWECSKYQTLLESQLQTVASLLSHIIHVSFI